MKTYFLQEKKSNHYLENSSHQVTAQRGLLSASTGLGRRTDWGGWGEMNQGLWCPWGNAHVPAGSPHALATACRARLPYGHATGQLG